MRIDTVDDEREEKIEEAEWAAVKRYLINQNKRYSELYGKEPINLSLAQIEAAIIEHPTSQSKRPFKLE